MSTSRSRVEVLKPGDVVQVKILQIDKEKNKVSLSRKAAMKDPLMLMLPGEKWTARSRAWPSLASSCASTTA